MPKGAASKDKKPAEKKSGGNKGKGKADEAADKGGKVRNIPIPAFVVPITRVHSLQGKGGLKAATAVNVRHILCEKHSKATEALQRIQVRHHEAVSSFLCYLFTRDLIWHHRVIRPESDSTKLLRNVPRTRPKVCWLVDSLEHRASKRVIVSRW
jgi:hypothetical protein